MQEITEPQPAPDDVGLRCQKCGHKKFRVVYTRGKLGAIVRRRQCLSCGARVTTWERVVG